MSLPRHRCTHIHKLTLLLLLQVILAEIAVLWREVVNASGLPHATPLLPCNQKYTTWQTIYYCYCYYCFLQLLFANRNCCCLFPRFLGCDAINLHLLSVSSPERKSACCNGVGGGSVSHNAAKSLKCHCGSGDKEEVTMTASALSS